jgi:alpha-glucosidase
MMKKFIAFVFCLLTLAVGSSAQFSVVSPHALAEARVEAGKQIIYSVFFNGKPVVTNSTIKFEFRQAAPLAEDFVVLKTSTKEINETWTPVLKRQSSILNNCNELTIQLQEKKFPRRTFNLVFRAYDDGVAFRTEFTGPDNKHEYVITDELVTFNFTADHDCWAANHGSYRSSQENEFFKRKLSEITDPMVIGLPMTVKVADDCYAAITEAEIDDYAGMYLKPGHSANGFSVRSSLSPLPKQPDNGDKVKFKFPHKTPWRVIMLGNSPGKLVESEIVMNLNPPCAIADPSWIKPGMCAWDHWWSGEVKMDNETIKKYIDLASEMGWPYQLIDWQWYGPFNTPEANITKIAPQLDMPGLLTYAKSKNVKCWVWLYNTDVDRSDWDKACATYESWGIAGVKIDFMDSDDQQMVNWYHRIVKTAAAHHLMVDFHGAYKPDGFRRTYPNLVTREGVMGNEYNKWSLRVTPEHITTLPFTRMLAGPMDFTPGGFLNRTPEKFQNGTPAQVLGTRAMQLAEFVVFDSPFMVACDHPDNYKGQLGEEFLKKVKTMWNETRILNGQIGEYITSARRSDNEWFIGSLNNSEARTLEIKLDFLGNGKYKMVAFQDDPESGVDAEKVMRTSKDVVKGDVVKFEMAPGGGFAAYLVPSK